MKWTLHQLNKYRFEKMQIKEKLSFKEEAETIDDIINIADVYVNGSMTMMVDKFIFTIEIKTKLTMQCAVTLQDVTVPLVINVEERFSDNEDDNQIEGITIDLEKYIWLNILAAKPMRVVAKGVSTDEFVEEPKKKVNPAFMDLKKYL